MNTHHHEEVEQFEKLASEIQVKPAEKPKHRRGRRTKAEIETDAAAVPVAPIRPQAVIGKDPYPTVVDTLGALTGCELVNGTEEDLVPIE